MYWIVCNVIKGLIHLLCMQLGMRMNDSERKRVSEATPVELDRFVLDEDGLDTGGIILVLWMMLISLKL